MGDMEAMDIIWARGLLMLRLDSMEDTMVDSMEDIQDMEAMDIIWARGLLMLRLSLDSMEDTTVDSVEDIEDMEALAIMDRFIVVDEQEFSRENSKMSNWN